MRGTISTVRTRSCRAIFTICRSDQGKRYLRERSVGPDSWRMAGNWHSDADDRNSFQRHWRFGPEYAGQQSVGGPDCAVTYPQGINVGNPWFSPTSFAVETRNGVFGNVGRNALTGPGFFNLDASVARVFRIKERYSLEFRAEGFSVTNTPQFTIRTRTRRTIPATLLRIRSGWLQELTVGTELCSSA